VSRRSERRARDSGRPRIDLHMHSDCSDGQLSPDRLLVHAAEGGLDVVALTDHDLAPVLQPGWHEVGGRKIRVIAGVELSTMYEDTEQHLLVYFPEEMPTEFAEWCTARARWRASWYDQVLDALALPEIPRADAAARAGQRTLTRLHLARALVDAGVVPSLAVAFKEWVGHDVGRIPPLNLGLLEALSVAVEAGGWTSWAHPQLAQAEAWASTLAGAGLHALEAWRAAGGTHRRDTLHRLAVRNHLAITGGSDWHGKGRRRLGSFSVPWRVLGETATALKLDARQLASPEDTS